MKRIIGYFLAALLMLGATQASAQSAVWTGDYYVVIGMNEKQEYAVTYGYHLKWHSLKGGPNFEGGTFADLTLAPLEPISNGKTAGRYELLAVGTKDGQAYAVTGYEWVDEPRFTDGMDPIANLTSATSATWAGSYYVVLGRAMGGDGVLPTPRDVIAYGRPGAWRFVYLPFNDELTFTHIVASPLAARPDRMMVLSPIDPPVPPYELLAVGTYRDGSAFAMLGYEADGVPFFSGAALPIPEIMNPVAAEWTGHDYLVVGDRGDGQFGVMHGSPTTWSRAEDFTLDGGKFTAMIAAPHPTRPNQVPGADLLAVGGLKGMAVSLPGTDVGGMPVFEHGCAIIPDLFALGEGFAPAPAAVLGGGNEVGVPYPNPFARAASFTVTVATDQVVRVAVFDVLGREVAVLHDGLLTAGLHPFTFDGGALPSGAYFVRAQGDGFVQTHQVHLTR
jgi:hypothetical protein